MRYALHPRDRGRGDGRQGEGGPVCARSVGILDA